MRGLRQRHPQGPAPGRTPGHALRDLQAARGKALTGAEVVPPEGEQVVAPPLPRRAGLLLVVAATTLLLDVVSKLLVVAHLEGREPIAVLGRFLQLDVSRNSGAAFSFAQGATVVFTIVAVAVAVVILRSARNLRSRPWALSLGLLLGGALGNLTDRLLRSPGIGRGAVVDWIHVIHYPVFNAADSGIVVGGVLAVLLASRGLELDGTRKAAEPRRTRRG